MNETHPLIVLTRPGGDVSSLYHSFMKGFIKNNKLEITNRYPTARRNLDDLESGIKLFLINQYDQLQSNNKDNLESNQATTDNSNNIDYFGFFVLTTSDSNRYYAIYKINSKLDVLIAISRLPIITFTRNILQLLYCYNSNNSGGDSGDSGGDSKVSKPSDIELLLLTEIPILPYSNISYTINVSVL